MSTNLNYPVSLQLPRRHSKPLTITQQRETENQLANSKMVPQQRQRSMLPEKGLANLIMLTSSQDNCTFCSKLRQKHPFSIRMRIALYDKYSASQNYYYTKDINELISNQRTSVVIRVKDIATLDEEEEFLNRSYAFHECDGKMTRLTEYYKFHRDISRMFMLPISNTLNKYHDKKRRIYYAQITRMLKEREGKKDPPQKTDNPPNQEKDQAIAGGDNPDQKDEHFQSFQLNERVLALLDETETKSIPNNTLLDLNMKLNDILQTSTRSTQSYFFENEASQTIGNLSNFLHHLQMQNSNTFTKNDTQSNRNDYQPRSKRSLERDNGLQQNNFDPTSSGKYNFNAETLNQKIQKDSQLFQKKQQKSQQVPLIKNNAEFKKNEGDFGSKAIFGRSQPSEKAQQIYQMNQEMIALGILKSSAPSAQDMNSPQEQNKIKEKLIQVGGLSHPPSHLVSPAVSSNPSSCYSKVDPQFLISKLPTNEAIGSPIEQIGSPSLLKIKEGAIIQAGKEVLKNSNIIKNGFVSGFPTQQSSQSQSIERAKSPQIKENNKEGTSEVTSPVKFKELKSEYNSQSQQNFRNPNQIAQQQLAQKGFNPSAYQQETQQYRSNNQVTLAANQSPPPTSKSIPKVQEHISPQFSLHLQQRHLEETKAGSQINLNNAKQKNDIYSGLFNQNSDRTTQNKQGNIIRTLSGREKDDSPISPSKNIYDKNNGKRLKTYEPISTRRENQLDLKASLHKARNDPYSNDQYNNCQINPLDSQNSLEGANLPYQHRVQQLIGLQDSNKCSPPGDLIATNSHRLSTKDFGKESNKLLTDYTPLKSNKGGVDPSPQKYGQSLHISKAKPSYSQPNASQSIQSSLRMSQGIPAGTNNSSQNDLQMVSSKGFPTKKSSINEIPELQMIFSSSQQMNAETTSLHRLPESGDTVSTLKSNNNQSVFKKSLSNHKFDNLGELKQFYKEVQRKTDLIGQLKDKEFIKPTQSGNPSISSSQELQQAKLSSQRKHNYFAKGDATQFQKGSVTQRFTQNSQDQSNSKEISPRIQRISKQEIKGNDHLNQISVALKQVLTDRDNSQRRMSSQLKSSSGTLSSPNLQLYGPNLQTQGSLGSSQTLQSGQRDNGQKKMQFKQQASKNNSDTQKTTHSNIDQNSKMQQLQSNSITIPNQMSVLMSNPINQLIPQYAPSSQPMIGENISIQQNSSKKILDKIKHSRINSMNGPTSVYQASQLQANPNHFGKSLQSQQIKQMNSDYGKIQTQPPQQLTGSQNSSQFSVATQNSSTKKKIYHKYNKSEADSIHQNNSQNQVSTNNLVLNTGNPLLGTQIKPQLSKHFSNPIGSNSQHNLQALQSSQQSIHGQDLKKGLISSLQHTGSSSQSSQSPQRGGAGQTGKKNLDQQQFFTYANNNIVNIYVNSQEGGNILQANNLINNQTHTIHQNIGSMINAQINANRNFNMQQNPAPAPAKKGTVFNGSVKLQQDPFPYNQKF